MTYVFQLPTAEKCEILERCKSALQIIGMTSEEIREELAIIETEKVSNLTDLLEVLA